MEPKEEFQSIENNRMAEGFTFNPSHVIRYFVSNIFQRTLSILRGFDGKDFPFLQCTSGGILKTASSGSIFEDNYSYNGTSADAWNAGDIFPEIAGKVEIWVNTNGMNIQRTKNGVDWQDTIYLPAASYYSFDASTLGIRVQSAVAGNHATYYINAWC